MPVKIESVLLTLNSAIIWQGRRRMYVEDRNHSDIDLEMKMDFTMNNIFLSISNSLSSKYMQLLAMQN